jgi:CDGSH-type Zn-finger protein/uncharacterized Fe-S cluster protein YjdI
MSDKYTGRAQDRRYQGEAVDITYNLKRCIHAESCIHNLSAVFDSKRRPWIDANGAAADEVTRVVATCPSGALHTERKDGGVGEAPPARNTIRLWQHGPVQFHGDLEIVGAAVELHEETRATLCRCGASQNKPFCDNAHLDSGFQADDPAAVTVQPLDPAGGKLRITVNPNRPMTVEGPMTILNAAGETIYSGTKTWLCRCGGSQRKPFCDSTHKKNGFQAE